MHLSGLGEPQHVQDDLVDGLVVQQRLDGLVVDDDGEQELGVLAHATDVVVLVLGSGAVAAPLDHRVEQAVDGRVGPPERFQGRLVNEQGEKLLDRVGEGEFAPDVVFRDVA